VSSLDTAPHIVCSLLHDYKCCLSSRCVSSIFLDGYKMLNLHRAKTRIQASHGKNGSKALSVYPLLLRILKEEGMAGYFRGFWATMLNTFSQREISLRLIYDVPDRHPQNTHTSSSTRSSVGHTCGASQGRHPRARKLLPSAPQLSFCSELLPVALLKSSPSRSP
jgi:hypothetical protein